MIRKGFVMLCEGEEVLDGELVNCAKRPIGSPAYPRRRGHEGTEIAACGLSGQDLAD
jgi:hypothetical protein